MNKNIITEDCWYRKTQHADDPGVRKVFGGFFVTHLDHSECVKDQRNEKRLDQSTQNNNGSLAME